MRKLFILSVLCGVVFFTADVRAEQACVDEITVTEESTVCNRLTCLQTSSQGKCTLWKCSSSKVSKSNVYQGCARDMDCGKNGVVTLGAADEPTTETNENCDWYPCVEADGATGNCTEYDCVSKRVSVTKHVLYPNASCGSKTAYAVVRSAVDTSANTQEKKKVSAINKKGTQFFGGDNVK